MRTAFAIALMNLLRIAALESIVAGGLALADERGAARPAKPPAARTKPRPAQPAPDYMPLSPGLRWEYDVTIELPLLAAKQAAATTKVEGLYEIDGKKYYKVVMQVSGAPVNPKSVAYCRPTAKGVFQILEGEEEESEWLYLPRELKVGQKWTAATSGSKFSFEVTGRGDVDCLGKTYKNCFQVTVDMQSKFGSIKQEQWLAPGVGLVKQVDHHSLFDSTAVLRKFVAGKPNKPD